LSERPPGERPGDALLGIAFAVLFGTTFFALFRYAPPTLRRPATVVSNGDARADEPFLIFLSGVAGATPPGSTVSIVPASGRDPWNWQDYVVAIGQLPGRRVILAARFAPPGAAGEVPRFAACFRGDLADPRFRLSARLAGGNLYERVP
jgi:hypothetical protein